MDVNLSVICQTCLSNERLLYPTHKLASVLDELDLFLKMDESSGICWECKAIIIRFLKFKQQTIRAQRALNLIVEIQDLKSLSALSYQNKYIYDLEIQYNDPLTTTQTENKSEIKLEVDADNEMSNENLSDNDVDLINEEIQDLKSLSALSYQNKYICDLEIQYNDPLTTTQTENKSEIKLEVDADNEMSNENLSDNDVGLINEEVCEASENLSYMENVGTKTKDNEVKKIECIKSENLKRRNSKYDIKEVDKKFTTVVYTEEEMLKNREKKRNHPNFKKVPYKCELCVLGFIRKETYELHVEKKHNENVGQHICDVCQSRFSSISSLNKHRKKHFILYRCRICDYESLDHWSAVNHCRAKHSRDTSEKIHCPQCSVIVRSPEELTEHIRSQHVLHCSECGGKFKGKQTLRRHKLRTHGVNRDFVCDICGKTFTKKSRLESHVVGHNSALAKKLAFCTVCNVQYKNLYIYRNHLKYSVNHSERVYECTECNKKFASKVYWKKHRDFYHLKKSQFKCEICNKLFISYWRLKNHQQTKHGLSRSRNYTCNVCDKKFFTLSTLRGHQLTHSEQRSYMCEDCGDTFKQRSALYNHSRLVHKGGIRRKQID